MRRSEARWNIAVAKHDAAVREFIAACESCPQQDWHRAPDGKWSAAAVALHVCNTYELGRDAMGSGKGMRLIVSPRYAWALRTFVLPWIIATTRFPRARAPREVVPGENETKRLTLDAARTRLMGAAREACETMRRAGAAGSAPRMNHAYFGPLSPYSALRLLTAHTRHHARSLSRKS
jgi:hypothetical protein